MAETVTPAPEQPTTGTMSAYDAAIVNDDLSALRAADNAERAGKPLPPVARPGVLSDEEYDTLRAKKDRGDFLTDIERKSLTRTERALSQSKVNERARKAAETVVSEYDGKLKSKDEEIAELRRQLQSRAEPAVPAQAEAARTGRPVPVAATMPAATELPPPDANDATKYPGGIYDPQYIEDRAYWRLQTETAKRDRETAERTARETGQRAWTSAKASFSEKLKAAVEADPEFKTVLDGDLASKQLVPVEEFRALQEANVLPKDAQPQPINFLASYLVGQSKIGIELLKYLHSKPEELNRVLAEGPPAIYRLEGQLLAAAATSTAPAPPPKKVVTDAPPPVTALGSREAAPTNPLEAAIAAGKDSLSGGVRDFKAAWREQNAPAARR